MPDMIRLAGEIDTVPESDNVTMWNLIIGFVSATFILPIIQRPSFSMNLRALITALWSVLAGFVVVWVAGDFDATDILKSIGFVFMAAIVTYKGFAQPTGIAPAIENATSPGSARKQPLNDPPATQ